MFKRILPLLLACAPALLCASDHKDKDIKSIMPLQAGDRMPLAYVQTMSGEELNLNRHLHGKHAAIIFYRGGWCPYCNKQLKELKKIEAALTGLGYEIIAVSADKPEKLNESANEIKSAYRLYSDSSMQAAKAFGIAMELDEETLEAYEDHGINLNDASGRTHHMLPVPSVFLVGPNGNILYGYTNDNIKIRLDAQELLRKANAHFRPSFY